MQHEVLDDLYMPWQEEPRSTCSWRILRGTGGLGGDANGKEQSLGYLMVDGGLSGGDGPQVVSKWLTGLF